MQRPMSFFLATAHMILFIAYKLLRNLEQCLAEPGAAFFEDRDRTAGVSCHFCSLQSLGFYATPDPVA